MQLQVSKISAGLNSLPHALCAYFSISCLCQIIPLETESVTVAIEEKREKKERRTRKRTRTEVSREPSDVIKY